MTTIAKIFMDGADQMVRLPDEFRFDCDEVCIKRIGSTVVLYERGKAWDIFENTVGKISDDFLADGRDQGGPVEQRKPF
jgi:antitoxin VapB